MYIRFFAATDNSTVATFALGYVRALMPFAPVRVISLSGGLLGPWEPYAPLQATPMAGAMINCVCAPPEKWSWDMKIAAPKSGEPTELEMISDRVGLHTPDAHRNVMFFCDLPRDHHQTKELLKFDSRITPVPAFRDAVHGSVLIPVPVADPAAFRELVIGKGSA